MASNLLMESPPRKRPTAGPASGRTNASGTRLRLHGCTVRTRNPHAEGERGVMMAGGDSFPVHHYESGHAVLLFPGGSHICTTGPITAARLRQLAGYAEVVTPTPERYPERAWMMKGAHWVEVEVVSASEDSQCMAAKEVLPTTHVQVNGEAFERIPPLNFRRLRDMGLGRVTPAGEEPVNPLRTPTDRAAQLRGDEAAYEHYIDLLDEAAEEEESEEEAVYDFDPDGPEEGDYEWGREWEPKPDDYREAPDGVPCPACDGHGDIDTGDGSAASPDRVGPQIHACSRCYGTGRVPGTAAEHYFEAGRWDAECDDLQQMDDDDLESSNLALQQERIDQLEAACTAALDHLQRSARLYEYGTPEHLARLIEQIEKALNVEAA